MRYPRKDLRVPDAEADLYLVGLGIGGFSRRSVETDELLRGCASILHLTAFHELLTKTYQTEVINLKSIYEASNDASRVYESMTSTIITYVKERRFLGPIAFVTYGHPLLLVDTSWSLIEICKTTDIRCKPILGSSFIDQALIDIEDRFDHGIQMFEANHFYQKSIHPDTRTPVILAQVGDFGSNKLRQHTQKLERLLPLFNHLQKHYPPGRKCAAFFSPWRSDMSPDISWTTIKDIHTLASRIHTGSSLYITGDHGEY